MNIKFEWTRSELDGRVYHCWVGAICCGFVRRISKYNYTADIGSNQGGEYRARMKHEITFLGEAKAWVEEQVLMEMLAGTTDLTFAEATHEDIKKFWEKHGFEPFGPGAKETPECWFRIFKLLKNRCGLGIDFQSRQLVYTYWEIDEVFGPPLSQSTTFGQALEILNELAATCAFGGWAEIE